MASNSIRVRFPLSPLPTISVFAQLFSSLLSDIAVKLVDINDITNSRDLTGHTRSLRCVVFSQDGKYLASACSFGSIRLWGLSSMSCVKNLYGLFPESEGMSVI